MRPTVTLIVYLLLTSFLQAHEKTTGTVDYQPLDDPQKVPVEYHLDAHQFPFEMELKKSHEKEGYNVYTVRFPSVVTTKFIENNTVHCEWYRPNGPGPFPTTVILDILGGDQKLARVQSAYLVQKGIACLFVQMAYYGPRRPPGSKVRLLMPDINHTLGAIRQTVLDVRRAGGLARLSARSGSEAAGHHWHLAGLFHGHVDRRDGTSLQKGGHCFGWWWCSRCLLRSSARGSHPNVVGSAGWHQGKAPEDRCHR